MPELSHAQHQAGIKKERRGISVWCLFSGVLLKPAIHYYPLLKRDISIETLLKKELKGTNQRWRRWVTTPGSGGHLLQSKPSSMRPFAPGLNPLARPSRSSHRWQLRADTNGSSYSSRKAPSCAPALAASPPLPLWPGQKSNTMSARYRPLVSPIFLAVAIVTPGKPSGCGFPAANNGCWPTLAAPCRQRQQRACLAAARHKKAPHGGGAVGVRRRPLICPRRPRKAARARPAGCRS